MAGGEPEASVVAIVPARFASTRFPGKPLAPIDGVPMIARVVTAVSRAASVGAVWVATDDERIAKAAEAAGGRAILTPSSHVSGSDRVAWAARRIPAEIVVNVQGDQPLVDPDDLDRLVGTLRADPRIGVATLAAPLADGGEWRRADVVKVVVDECGDALYFSRAPVPYAVALGGEPPPEARKHVGVYGFRRAVLLEYAAARPSSLEQIEQLEQLRLLERGVRIRVIEARSASLSVDRPEDVTRVEQVLAAMETARQSGSEAARRSGHSSRDETAAPRMELHLPPTGRPAADGQ